MKNIFYLILFIFFNTSCSFVKVVKHHGVHFQKKTRKNKRTRKRQTIKNKALDESKKKMINDELKKPNRSSKNAWSSSPGNSKIEKLKQDIQKKMDK